MRFLVLWITLLLPLAAIAGQPAEFYLTNVATLIEPARLAALGKRKASERVQKAVALLEDARQDGFSVSAIADNAVWLAHYTNAWLGSATYNQLCKNHQTADFFGVLNEAGLKEMRQGKAPTIPRGKFKGQTLSVDGIVPSALAPELDHVVANLQLMPLNATRKRNITVGPQQLVLARQFRTAGVISDASCKRLLKHQQSQSNKPLPQELPNTK